MCLNVLFVELVGNKTALRFLAAGNASDTFKVELEGVFLYRVDERGKILSLRAFWEFERPQLEGDIHPPVGRER